MDTPYDRERGSGAARGRRSPHVGNAGNVYDRLGQGDYGGSPNSNRGTRPNSQQAPTQLGGGLGGAPAAASNPALVAQLKLRVRQCKDAYDALRGDYDRSRTQVQDYQARLKRSEDSHRLEVQRLRKEADYHKRLRQGAEARAAQLAKELGAQQRQAEGFDEAQSGLIQQSQVLLAANSELKHKLQQSERELAQQREAMSQLTLQLEQLALENEQLRLEYDQMVAGKFAQSAEGQEGMGLSSWPADEDDYDLELYGEEAPDASQGASTPEATDQQTSLHSMQEAQAEQPDDGQAPP